MKNVKKKILIKKVIQSIQNKDFKSAKESVKALKNFGTAMILYSKYNDFCFNVSNYGNVILSFDEAKAIEKKFEKVIWHEVPDLMYFSFVTDHQKEIDEFKQLHNIEIVNR